MLPLLNARFAALRITSNVSRTRLAPATATRSLFVAARTRPVVPTYARTFLSSAAAESPAKKSTSTETSESKPKKKATGEKKTPAKKPKKVVLKKVKPKAAKKPAKPKKPVLPKIPSRTPGVYAYWLSKRFLPNYSTKLSDPSATRQAFKEASIHWKALTEAERLQLKEERDAVAVEQAKVREEFINTLSPATLHAINRQRQAKGKASVTIPVEKRKPRNAYLRFMDDLRNVESFGTIVEQSKEAARRWKGMSDSEKEPYVKAYEKETAEYRAKYSE